MKLKHISPLGYFKNSDEGESHKETVHFDIETNAIKVIDDETIKFSRPVVITDNSEMWSGASYDIATLDISEYRGVLTADHRDMIQNVLGTVMDVKKVGNKKITIGGIKFASKVNPLADYAKRMMLAGYLTDFSIETIGPWPDEDRIFRNAKLVGLSLVVSGNNKQAHISKIAEDTMVNARKNGLDVTSFAQALKIPLDNEEPVAENEAMKFKTIKNSRGFAIVLKYKNAAGEDTQVTVAPGQSVDVPDNEANKGVDAQVTGATEPTPEAPAQPETPPSNDNKEVSAIVEKAVQAAVKPLQEKLEAAEKNAFDHSVTEPQFSKANNSSVTSTLVQMNWRERHAKQINYAWDMLKAGNMDAGRQLNEINKFHMEKLQEAEKVPNSVTISDFGNFVISPELLTEIEGFRSNFKNLLAKLTFRDTLSLQMAWLTRSGDINMQEVEFCDDGEDGNLKPISEYSAEITTDNLHELAAVTPVCNAATRFLAADLLEDVAGGYRTDFDRKRAQIFIARLQQAVNSTGNLVNYNTGTGGGGANVNALQSFMDVAGMQEQIMGGTYILSQASYWELMKRQAAAGINTDSGFRIFTTGENGPLMFGAPYIVVPNELLPKLGSSQTRQFIVAGVTVTITEAVFYADLSTFTGRTSGGLNYDLSTEAAYEDNGTVKSAFQRNELVLRGSFFRGGAVRDPEKVVGLRAVNLS